MKRMAVTLAFVMIAVLFVSCRTGINKPGTQQQSGQPQTTDSKPEVQLTEEIAPASGKIVIACGGGPDGTVDPVYVNDGFSGISSLAFEGLVKQESGWGQVKPHLAESWTVGADGTSYTFKLKPDVKFYDGTPVEADDWIWSLERAVNAAESPWASYLGKIESVRFDTTGELIIKLKQPDASFVSSLALSCFSVQSKAHAEKLGADEYKKSPMGTGPYYYGEWTGGESYSLIKNTYYHGANAPNASGIEFKVINDENRRVGELLSGGVDICLDVPTNRASEIALEGIKVERSDMPVLRFINFNTQKAPFDNPEVRRALRMAIDGNYIVKMVFFGYAKPASNVFAAYGPDFGAAANDASGAEAAKAALEQAGFPQGFEAKLVYPDGNASAEGIANILKEEWAKIGVSLTLSAVKSAELSSNAMSLEHEITMLRWADVTNDPSALAGFISIYDASSGFCTGYQNQKLTELYSMAAASLDTEQRKSMYREMAEILYTDCPMFPLYQAETITGMRENITGFRVEPFGGYDVSGLRKS